MSCGCSSPDSSCTMYLYVINNTGSPPSGGPMTLQDVSLDVFAPCAAPVIPSSDAAQLVAWAYDWDDPGTISYNMPNGEVLSIKYTGGSVDDVDATFPSSSQTYYAQKSSYQNGILISIQLQTGQPAA